MRKHIREKEKKKYNFSRQLSENMKPKLLTKTKIIVFIHYNYTKELVINFYAEVPIALFQCMKDESLAFIAHGLYITFVHAHVKLNIELNLYHFFFL